MGHRDGFRRARVDTEATEDAAQQVDVVHEPVPFPRTHRIVHRVVGAAYIDAGCRAGSRAEFATDAFLHPVGMPVEDVTTVKTLRLLARLLGVLGGQQTITEDGLAHHPEGHRKPFAEFVDHAHGEPRTSYFLLFSSSFPVGRRGVGAGAALTSAR